MKIAILGASGIGKSHARWFAAHGCEIVSILGSSDDSAALTGADLAEDFGFAGLTYSNLSALLEETKPEAVCISTPSVMHYVQSLECLEAGVHVLCEKPLVYVPTRKPRENLDGAKGMVELARKNELILGTQLQYGAATPILCKLAGTTPPEVGDFAMEIETSNPRAPRDARGLWMDLGPHPLSIAQMVGGADATLVEESIRLRHSEAAHSTEVMARFSVCCTEGRFLMCRAILRAFDANAIQRKPLRRFSFNGRVVSYQGISTPDGTYRAQYTAPDGYDNLYPDPVCFLIGDFIRAVRQRETPLISGDFGMKNLEWLLQIAEQFDENASTIH